MRPAFVSILFLVIAGILFVLSSRPGKTGQAPSPIARRVRRRTASIFVAVAIGLLILDLTQG
jgi:hypothetical protein